MPLGDYPGRLSGVSDQLRANPSAGLARAGAILVGWPPYQHRGQASAARLLKYGIWGPKGGHAKGKARGTYVSSVSDAGLFGPGGISCNEGQRRIAEWMP